MLNIILIAITGYEIGKNNGEAETHEIISYSPPTQQTSNTNSLTVWEAGLEGLVIILVIILFVVVLKNYINKLLNKNQPPQI